MLKVKFIMHRIRNGAICSYLRAVMADLLCHRVLTCMWEMARKTISPGTHGLAGLRARGSTKTQKNSVLACMRVPAPKLLVSGMHACPMNSWLSYICAKETQNFLSALLLLFQVMGAPAHERRPAGQHACIHRDMEEDPGTPCIPGEMALHATSNTCAMGSPTWPWKIEWMRNNELRLQSQAQGIHSTVQMAASGTGAT